MTSKKHAVRVSFNGTTQIVSNTSNSSSSSSNSSIMVVDPSPPVSPNSPDLLPLELPIINAPYSEEEMQFRKSMVGDLDDVLNIDSPAYKGVVFVPSSPIKMQYTVSHEGRRSQLKQIGPLFPVEEPLESTESQMPQDIVSKSKPLQAAAAKAVVKTDGTTNCSQCDECKEEQNGNSKKNGKFNKTKRKKKGKKRTSKGAYTPRTRQLITLYLEQSLRSHGPVRFDRISVTESNAKTVLLSSNGMSKGSYQWRIEILKSDVDLQEIGVIGTKHIDHIPVKDGGVFKTKALKCKAIYGSEMSTGTLFYGSWNSDGKKRCHRDLSPYFDVGWTVGSVITVSLNLTKWRIKFLLNGKAVKNTMSVEPHQTYWPMICFSGNCKYYLYSNS